MKNPLQKNQKVYFIGEGIPMKVLAASERYAVCVRKLDKSEDDDLLEFEVKRGARFSKDEAYDDLKDNPVYSILDFQEQIRGSDNYVLGMYDYFDEDDCQAAIEDIESGGMEISHRNRVKLNIDWEKTVFKSEEVKPHRNIGNYSPSSSFSESSNISSNSDDNFISPSIWNDSSSSDSGSSSSDFDGFGGGGDFGGGGASGDW